MSDTKTEAKLENKSTFLARLGAQVHSVKVPSPICISPAHYEEKTS